MKEESRWTPTEREKVGDLDRRKPSALAAADAFDPKHRNWRETP